MSGCTALNFRQMIDSESAGRGFFTTQEYYILNQIQPFVRIRGLPASLSSFQDSLPDVTETAFFVRSHLRQSLF